jgi:hypothetical protein
MQGMPWYSANPLELRYIAYHSHLLHLNIICAQVRSREEELMNLGSLHTASKAAADKRIAELEGRVSRLLEANR